MMCANGCLNEINAGESSSITVRELGNGVCIHEHRHLDCTRRVFLDGETPPTTTITAE